MVGRPFVFLQFIWSEENLMKITINSSEASPETWWGRGRRLRHLLMIAHGLPPRPGWPLPGLQDPLDQQRVLGECSVNVSNSCREICRATAYTMSSLFKSTPRTLPIIQVPQSADDAGWDIACPGIGRSPLAPAVLLSSVGNWELTARCTGLGDSD